MLRLFHGSKTSISLLILILIFVLLITLIVVFSQQILVNLANLRQARLDALWKTARITIRRRLYRNLREIAIASGAIDRLPTRLVDLLLVA